MSLRGYMRFSVLGLLHATAAVAVFFAFFRLSDLIDGLFAAVATYLATGLGMQAGDIWRAWRQSGWNSKWRTNVGWNVGWRCGLVATVATVFVTRFVYLPQVGLFGIEDPADPSLRGNYGVNFLSWTPPFSQLLLLLSLIVTNPHARRRTVASRGQMVWTVISDGIAMILAAVWLAILLADVILLTVLTHFSIRTIENHAALVLMGHYFPPGLCWKDQSLDLFTSMGISSLAGGICLVSIRWLARVWESGWWWRLAPLGVYLPLTAWQVERLNWALGTAVPQVAPRLWESRPQEVTTIIALGGVMLLIGVTALAHRWTVHARVSLGTPALTWRRPGHFYPHEWALLLLALPACEVYNVITSMRGSLSDWLEGYFVQPGTLLYLALVLTAAVRYFRWLRGDEISAVTEIRELNLAKGLTIWSCLLLTAILAIPALGLTAFAGWNVLGGVPVR